MTPSRLVGRERELDTLERALERVQEGAETVVELVGEPGIGKTHLLSELAARAVGRGVLVLRGRSTEFEQHDPFGLIVDALDTYLSGPGSDALPGLSRSERDSLAAIFPGLTDGTATRSPIPSGERYRTHYAVRALLQRLARQRAVLVALDDVHWADAASLEALAHLVRRPPRGVLIAVAYRSTWAATALSAVLYDARHRGVSCQVTLAPLTRTQAGELLGAAFSEERRETLFRESGGNPFYLEQLARATTTRQVRSQASHGAETEAPLAVAEALAAEVAVLSGISRLVAQAASVVGDPFRPDLVAAAASIGEDECLAALDELIERDLVRPTETPPLFSFRHPIVRRAVYDSSPRGWRIGAHRRAAVALAAQHAPPLDRAHHEQFCARVGDEASIALLTEAARAAAALAPATAARYLDAATRLLPSGADDARQRELLLELAIAQSASGELEAAGQTLRKALSYLTAEECAPERAHVAALMAFNERLLGHHDTARRTLLEAIAGLPQAAVAEATALQLEVAADCYFRSDWPGTLAEATRARELARQSGELVVDAGAATLLAVAHYGLGDVAASQEYIAEAARIVDSLDDAALARKLETCVWLGFGEYHLCRFDEAVAHLRRGLDIARASRTQEHLLPPLHFGLAAANGLRGHLSAAREDACVALEMGRLSGVDRRLAWGYVTYALAVGRAGDLRDARTSVEIAERTFAAISSKPHAGTPACMLAEIWLEVGEPRRARSVLLDSPAGNGLRGIEPGLRPVACEILVRAALALDEHDVAAQWAGRAVTAAADLRSPLNGDRAALAAAAVAFAGGQFPQAAKLALAAARGAGAAGLRFDAARARLLAGRALARGRDRGSAVGQLRQAHADFGECGARRHRDAAAAGLRALGEPVGRPGRKPRSGTGIAALSRRELEVVELVTARLTNTEIAERLVVSPKTVERHLSRIFIAVGVSRRADLARAYEAECGDSRASSLPHSS